MVLVTVETEVVTLWQLCTQWGGGRHISLLPRPVVDGPSPALAWVVSVTKALTHKPVQGEVSVH